MHCKKAKQVVKLQMCVPSPYALLDGYVWRTPLFHLPLHISHHVATLARSLFFDCLLHLEEERNNRNGKTQKDLLLCQGGVQSPSPLPRTLFVTPSLNILPHTHTHADRRPSTQSFPAGSKIVTDGMQICLHSESSNSYSSATCRRIWLFTMRYPRAGQ